jgi:hypothetical protein
VEVAQARLLQAFRTSFGVEFSQEHIGVYCSNPLAYKSLDGVLRSVDYHHVEPPGRLLVVGNPPYTDAKRLPRQEKAAVKALHPTATDGALDHYYAPGTLWRSSYRTRC